MVGLTPMSVGTFGRGNGASAGIKVLCCSPVNPPGNLGPVMIAPGPANLTVPG